MPRLCSSLLLSLLIASSANAITLTFEGITTTEGYVNPVPNGYGNLNWTNFYVVNGQDPFYVNTGYGAGTVSGQHVAYNYASQQATTAGSPFDFNSVYLTAAWNTGLNIRVRGLNSGNLLYDNTVVVNPDAPTLFNFNYLGIDRLIFDSFGGVGPGGTQFAMDDMTINAIPEPGTGLLVIGGLLGLAGWRRGRA